MTRPNRFVVEWLVLAVAVRVIGALGTWTQYGDHRRIGEQERERLGSHAELAGQNLVPALQSINRALEGILEEMPRGEGSPQGYDLMNRRLQLASEMLGGVRTLVVMDAQGLVRPPDGAFGGVVLAIADPV
jgi:hypothetical protein